MRISDWSSDVCSSDLDLRRFQFGHDRDHAMTMMLFPMPGNERMTNAIAERVGCSVGKLALRRFPDGESYIRLHSAVAGCDAAVVCTLARPRSEEHTSELQSLMRISYAVFCLNKKKTTSTTILH